MPNKYNNTRSFTWDNPALYNGQDYPTTLMPIDDGNGNIQNTTVFADRSGNYFNQYGTPVILQQTLPEVVVHPAQPTQEEMAATMFNNYLTMSNDRTKVNNLPHRQYNQHLNDRTLQGAKSNTIWEKEHPNLDAWGKTLAAIPFAVAAAPAVIAAGDGLAGTAAGQYIKNKAIKALANPLVEMANVGLGVTFGSKGLNNMVQGDFSPTTIFDVATLPLALKSTIGLTNRYLRNPNNFFKGEYYLPHSIRKNAANRYKDFIYSQDYQNRIKNAGFGDEHWDAIKRDAHNQLDNVDYFPAREQTVINNEPNTLGISVVSTGNIFSKEYSPYRGITIKHGLPPQTYQETLDHEIAHYATKNKSIDDKGYIGDIMTYNESIAPDIPWTEVAKEEIKANPSITIDDMNKAIDRYEYLTDPQEKRARAYSILQSAKKRNITTDKLVDTYTKDGYPVWWAPDQLQDMLGIMSPTNLKQYLNNFLGIVSPIGVATILNNSQEKDYEHFK